jgi:hypothetical protein
LHGSDKGSLSKREVAVKGWFRRRDEQTETVEVALPWVARERAEEIVRLSHSYSDQAAGFRSPGEVIGPALLYGLAHMHERYSEAASRRGQGGFRQGTATGA